MKAALLLRRTCAPPWRGGHHQPCGAFRIFLICEGCFSDHYSIRRPGRAAMDPAAIAGWRPSLQRTVRPSGACLELHMCTTSGSD